MLGLLPALRIVKELEQRTPSGDREQEPMERRQQEHPGVRQQPAPPQPDHIQRDRRGIAAAKSRDKHRRGMHGADELRRGCGRSVGRVVVGIRDALDQLHRPQLNEAVLYSVKCPDQTQGICGLQ